MVSNSRADESQIDYKMAETAAVNVRLSSADGAEVWAILVRRLLPNSQVEPSEVTLSKSTIQGLKPWTFKNIRGVEEKHVAAFRELLRLIEPLK